MDTHLFQSLSVATYTLIFLFVVFYFFKLHKKEKELEKREHKIDTEYHHVVDEALSKERKILEDAIKESEKIIMDTKFLSHDSKARLDQSLNTMVTELQRDALSSTKQYNVKYQMSLQHAADSSLRNFEHATTSMEEHLQLLIKQFTDNVLPAMQKDLEVYKQTRMQEMDKSVASMVQKVAQTVLNKSIPLTDHNQLIIEALEKAKNQGLFDDYSAKPAAAPHEAANRNQEIGTNNPHTPPISHIYPTDKQITDKPQSENGQPKTDNELTPDPQSLSDEIRAQSPGIVHANDYGHPQPN